MSFKIENEKQNRMSYLDVASVRENNEFTMCLPQTNLQQSLQSFPKLLTISLCEKCPNAEFFPVFGLNMEIYGVNLRIQSEYGKIQTSRNSVL